MLESFTEMRSTAESIETGASYYASTSNGVDHHHFDYSPNPWDFDIQPDVEFSDQVPFFKT